MSGLRSAVGPVSALGTGQCSRSARILRVAEALFPYRSLWGAWVTTPPSWAAVGSGRGAGPALRAPGWKGTRSRIPPRIRFGIPTASSPAECDEPGIRTRPHGPESLEIPIAPNG